MDASSSISSHSNSPGIVLSIEQQLEESNRRNSFLQSEILLLTQEKAALRRKCSFKSKKIQKLLKKSRNLLKTRNRLEFEKKIIESEYYKFRYAATNLNDDLKNKNQKFLELKELSLTYKQLMQQYEQKNSIFRDENESLRNANLNLYDRLQEQKMSAAESTLQLETLLNIKQETTENLQKELDTSNASFARQQTQLESEFKSTIDKLKNKLDQSERERNFDFNDLNKTYESNFKQLESNYRFMLDNLKAQNQLLISEKNLLVDNQVQFKEYLKNGYEKFQHLFDANNNN